MESGSVASWRTFLFTDLAGAVEDFVDDPGAMASEVERHGRLASDVVRAHGGEVFRRAADGVAAVFEEPIGAVCAARDLHAAVGDPSAGTGGLAVGVGVHAGPATRHSGDWIGPATHRCARLARLAVGRVLVSQAVVAGLDRPARPAPGMEDLGVRDVPGVGPMHVHRLDGEDGPRSVGMRGAAPAFDTVPAARGRSAEHAALRAMVVRAATHPEVLVVHGEAGIGKTVLWRDALVAARLHGLSVWSALASPPGSRRPFGVLADLLDSLEEDDLAPLPAVQRAALGAVLHRRDPGGQALDWVVTATGVRSLLVAAAFDRPLLLAVDDAPWVDDDSARVLAHVLRRLDGVPVSLLATARTGPGEDSAGWVHDTGLPLQAVGVGPMPEDEVADLLQAVGLARERPPVALRRLARRAEGNPLLALELARVDGGGTSGALGGGRAERIRELVVRRLDRLDGRTRDVLGLLALDTGGSPEVLRRAAGSDGLDDALGAAEAVGLVVVESGRARFAHPLHGHAVRTLLDAPQARALHRRLAAAVDDELERAHHLAVATTLPDEEVAATVAAAAATALQRGAATEAAALAERAVDLTPDADPDRMATRGLVAAHAALDTADDRRGRAVLERIRSLDLAPDVRARVELARLRWFMEDVDDYLEVSGALLERDDLAEPTVVRAMLMQSYGRLLAGDLAGAARTGRAALDRVDGLGDVLLRAAVLSRTGQVEDLLGRPSGRGLLEEAVHLAGDTPTTSGPVAIYDAPRTALGLSHLYADDVATAREHLLAQIDLAGARGQEMSAAALRIHAVEVEVRAGNLAVADEHLRAMAMGTIPEELEVWPGNQYAMGLVATVRGDVDAARRHARAGTTAARRYGQDLWVLGNTWVRGHLELSLGNARAADRHLAPLAELGRRLQMAPVVHRVAPDVAEAAVAVGDLDRAEVLVAELEAVVPTARGDWTGAVAARVRALLATARGEEDRADAAVEEALARAADLPDPHERGRIDLVAGAIHRRRGRRALARDHLERAVAVLEELGATAWAARAGDEAARVSGRARAASTGLTETEQQVADLAASGLTNREIATRMYLSPKTVEHNLTRVYRKLGIRSRTELAARGTDPT